MWWINTWVGEWRSRISFGVAFFIALAVGLWPDHARAIDPTKLAACITAGLAWIIAEIASIPTDVSPHDVALFQRITGVLDDDALAFLAERDFGYDIHERQMQPINTVAAWSGPNYIFNDAVIHERWQALFNSVLDLSSLSGKTLGPANRPSMLTAWLTGFPRHQQPENAHAEVRALNEAATVVYRQLNEFIPFVRRRLRL